jgi:hypothetical protein
LNGTKFIDTGHTLECMSKRVFLNLLQRGTFLAEPDAARNQAACGISLKQAGIRCLMILSNATAIATIKL